MLKGGGGRGGWGGKLLVLLTNSGNNELKTWHNPHGCAFQHTDNLKPTSLLKPLKTKDLSVVKNSKLPLSGIK